MREHPNRIWDLIGEVRDVVEKTQRRAGWNARETLRVLDIAPSTYYRVLKLRGLTRTPSRRNIYELLPEERAAIISYALANPNPRHRELAWKMVDDGIVCASPSTVYRVLEEHGLVPKWPVTTDEGQESRPRYEWATVPDEKWQVDISYVNIDGRWWFLLFFIDEYSRYIVHWELLWSMDANTILLEAEKALTMGGQERHPTIQTDNGPPFISREFKRYLSYMGIAHKRIHPHTPEENAIIERGIRTIKELAGTRFSDLGEAKMKLKEMIGYYNNERLHSAIGYIAPRDKLEGRSQAIFEQRRRKLTEARARRKRRFACQRTLEAARA